MILSIVIVNWNGKELTKNCIRSILETCPDEIKDLNFEIIVIDNGSYDGSAEHLNIFSDSIRLIKNNSNMGYASACNRGMREAKGKYVLLLGNDTIVMDQALQKCLKFLDEKQDCGAVGCRLLNPDGSVQNNCKKFPTLLNGFYTYLSLDRLNHDYDMSRFRYDKTIEVEQISTSFLMVRKDLLEKIGYFDKSYKILYNDVDLCKRIWVSGKKIYFLHTAEVIHYGSQSTKKAGFRERKIMYSDIYRYYRNNFGLRAVMLLPILTLRLALTLTFKN